MISLYFLEEEYKPLEEAKVSVVKRGLAGKRAALAGGSAMAIAKKTKFPACPRVEELYQITAMAIKDIATEKSAKYL